MNIVIVAAAHVQSIQLSAQIDSKYNWDADDDMSASAGCDISANEMPYVHFNFNFNFATMWI
jgi:hypothetical protein